MPPAANVLSKKLRHGGVARSPLADTDLLGETFARGVEDRLRLLVKTHDRHRRSAPPGSPSSPTPPRAITGAGDARRSSTSRTPTRPG